MHTFKLVAAASLAAISLAGCGGGDAPAGAGLQPQASVQRTGPTAPSAPATAASLQGLPQASTATRGPLATGADFGYSVNPQNREQVRLFYKTVFASSEGFDSGWTGNVAGCVAGETSSEYKAAVLRRVNWFRAMAGVPATVQFDPTLSAKAQQAALFMSANNTLTHTPTSGLCFNATVAEAAGKSNLAFGSSGVESITNYINDSGPSNNVAGHRRWLLYPQTRLMGTGDITGSPQTNAIWIQDSHFFDARPAVRDTYVAWPAKGYSPYTTTYARWSFSHPLGTFTNATITMTENGIPISTCKETVQNGFGENSVVWRPKCMADGATWDKPAGDTTYHVTISNIVGVAPTSYDVIVFDPDVAGTGDGPITISGAASIPAAKDTAYSFAAVPGATSYQWRWLQSDPYTLNDGAESGAGNFAAPVNPGYSVVATDVKAQGGASFHLTHAPGVDQSLVLNTMLGVTPTTQLEFKSRLGVATPAQVALVEISTDDGHAWVPIYSQAGTDQPGETSFSTKTLSLASYADRTVRIRFRYQRLAVGAYYNQSDAGVGWYLDDIKITGATAVSVMNTSEAGTPTFNFSGAGVGNVLLQARPGMNGYFAEWGLTKAVAVTAAIDRRDCLFNWAEAALPGILAPHVESFDYLGFYLRYYPATNFYLGINSGDSSVYYYFNGNLVNLGNTEGWFNTAGCH
ncbi:CAP domain-containing protein [Caenimonas koreensis]|uniref:CAP domain-containing protein n=1 Tax=Caenimonas koreensis TaxID=367474 RepID=UPI003783A109